MFLHSTYYVVVFYDKKKLVLRYKFPLEMLSAVPYSKRNYSAMPLARQLIHQRFVILGPLVQENGSRNFLHPKKIGSILSYDVLNPTHVPLSSANSRTLRTFFSPRMR